MKKRLLSLLLAAVLLLGLPLPGALADSAFSREQEVLDFLAAQMPPGLRIANSPARRSCTTGFWTTMPRFSAGSRSRPAWTAPGSSAARRAASFA